VVNLEPKPDKRVKQAASVLFLLALATNSFGQDFRMQCDSVELEWMNGGKAHWRAIMNCPYVEHPTADSIPHHIRDANGRYLAGRMGMHFLEVNLIFLGAVIIRHDLFDTLEKVHPWIDKDACDGRIAYAFEHCFLVQDSMRFYFTTIFDRKGQLVTPHQIPDMPMSADIRWVSACEARSIAEADDSYAGRVEGISFEYYKPCNCFVWKARKTQIRNGRKIITPYALVDARSGKVLDHVLEKGTIVCSMGSW